ncbi:hypothetical protein ABZ543_08345 [Streptomyces roseifaciens]
MLLPDPDTITNAVARGIIGDRDAAMELLQPLLDKGPLSAFRMLGALAEVASPHTPDCDDRGNCFVIVEGPKGTETIDEAPPAIRFAVQFVQAWSNHDMNTALDLFQAVAETDGDTLAAGTEIVFDMAVASAEYLLADHLTESGEPR